MRRVVAISLLEATKMILRIIEKMVSLGEIGTRRSERTDGFSKDSKVKLRRKHRRKAANSGMKNDRTIVVAITGGIGSGKSSVLSMMADLGARVIDADKLAREALSKGAPAYLKMVERYGPSILDQNKEIDRSALASIAFDSDDDRTFIEKAIHPFVKNEINRLASEFSKTGTRVVAAEIPLLFEVGWEKEFGAVITWSNEVRDYAGSVKKICH